MQTCIAPAILYISYNRKICISNPIKIIEYCNTSFIVSVSRFVKLAIVWLRFPCTKTQKISPQRKCKSFKYFIELVSKSA